jgi:hypothetical protein
MQLPTQERLKELFTYSNGQLIHNSTGRIAAANQTKTRYKTAAIDRRSHDIHRIVWKMFHGYEPQLPYVIDHINRDRYDNRLENLRCITQSENCRNSDRCDNAKSSSEYGIYHRVRKGRRPHYQVMLTLNGSLTYIGIYYTLDEARVARDKYLVQMHLSCPSCLNPS